MKHKTLYTAVVAFGVMLLSTAFTFSPNPQPASQDIEWLTWEQAQEKMKKEPRKIMIDVYTDWCGWCKRMDATTFVDPKIVGAINEKFYAVKLDAEQKEDIVFDNHVFKFVPSGNRGHHELAASLLDNSMSYPSFVVLDENMQRVMIIKGFQQALDMLCILDFTASNQYKTISFDDYKANWKQQ